MQYSEYTGDSRLKNEIGQRLRQIKDKLCELLSVFTSPKEGVDCEGNPTSVPNAILTVPHPDSVQLVKFCQEKLDPEIVCISNDGGITIIKGFVEFDLNTTPSTTTLYLFDGSLATGYEIVPCDKPMQYDYEEVEVCVDGLSYTKWFVWDKFGDGLPNLIGVLWLDETDTIVPAPDSALIDNENCNVCQPNTESFKGNLATLPEFNDIVVFIPQCCEVTITNSAGSIVLPTQQSNWVYTQRYDCLVSNYNISSSCVDEITTILTKTK